MLVVPTAADTGSLLRESLPSPDFQVGTSLHDIAQRGVVRVAVATDAGGFCSLNDSNGRLEGVDVTIARRLAQGIFGGTIQQAANHVEFVDTSLADRIQSICEGRADFAIAVFAATNERRKILDFTSAYYGTALGVVVRSDCDVCNVADLNGLRLGVIEGTADEQFATRKGITANMVQVGSYVELALALATDKIDAAIAASAVFDGYADIWGPAAHRLPLELDSYQYAVAVRKGDGHLRSFLDHHVRNIIDHRLVSYGDALRRKIHRPATHL
jgi:ABC-type amino acid transport substrate-binding protein